MISEFKPTDWREVVDETTVRTLLKMIVVKSRFQA
jgi:hypothetical protein